MWPSYRRAQRERVFYSLMTRDLIHTVLPTVSQTFPEPDPSAHPLRLWCAWNSRCWRRTPSPLGFPGAYTSAKSVLVWGKGQTLSSLFWHGFERASFNTNTVLPLQACWNPACDPSGTPCFACVQSAGYRPWWTPHVLAWVQPGRYNANQGMGLRRRVILMHSTDLNY